MTGVWGILGAGFSDLGGLGFVAAALAGGAVWIWLRRRALGRQLVACRAENAAKETQIEELLREEASHREVQSEADGKLAYLASVSHELRTPLAGIRGLCDLLRQTAMDGEQTTYVEAIHASANGLGRLVDEMLDFSKIEAGGFELEAGECDIRAAIEGVAEFLAPEAQGRGIEIATWIEPAVPQLFRCDGHRFRQVLLNLAGNAVKYTDRGGVGIEAWQRGERLVFLVRDTGIGIPSERRRAIFQEYQQADAQVARRRGGTGLGLPIALKIVRLMGGDLTLAGSGENGSQFEFWLPAGAGAAPPQRAHPVPDEPPCRVLLLAPLGFQANYLSAQLRAAGVSVDAVPDLGAARQALAGSPPIDMLMADCVFGPEAVNAVGALAREAKVGRMILLLSPFERRHFGAAAERGFDGWLTKPVRRVSLMRQVEAMAQPPAERAVSATAAANILLAEDDDIGALIATRHLAKLGAAVTRAKRGDEALALALAALQGVAPAFDAAILDIRMPGLSGDAIALAIRAAEAAAGRRSMCLVALTSENIVQQREQYRAAGFDMLQPKPMEPTWLAEMLADVAAKREAEPRAGQAAPA